MKHTPGPWLVRPDEAIAIRAEDGSLLATLGWSNGRHFAKGRRDANEVYANAHLIAAAPELLAMVRHYASDCAECDGTGFKFPGTPILDHACEDCADIRALIDKAEGASR